MGKSFSGEVRVDSPLAYPRPLQKPIADSTVWYGTVRYSNRMPNFITSDANVFFFDNLQFALIAIAYLM